MAPACCADGAALLRMHGRGRQFVWRADGVGGIYPGRFALYRQCVASLYILIAKGNRLLKIHYVPISVYAVCDANTDDLPADSIEETA